MKYKYEKWNDFSKRQKTGIIVFVLLVILSLLF